jgi:4-hydroxy-tetrahydrodipicolinate synthase
MLTGSMVALVTPMEADGSICWDSLEKLIEFHIDNGTTAIVAVGTTGESATLSVKEHTKVIQFVVQKVNKRCPVIAGTGANATLEAIELTASAKAAGADACLLVTPYYNKPGQEGLFQHYTAIANQVDIPQILYNVPGRTACDLLPNTVARLAQHPNIVGIKEATGDVSRVKMISSQVPDDFTILSGDDATCLDLIKEGGHGVISVTANVMPAQMAAMCQAALAGEYIQAEAVQQSMMILHDRMLSVEANPIPVKWVLAEMGMMPSGIRLPLTWLDKSHEADLREAMVACHLVK